MKIRLTYVSNSSSTSSVEIVNFGEESLPRISTLNKEVLLIPSPDAHHKFGWEWVDYDKFEDKLNFVAIQLMYLKMLDLRAKKHPQVKEDEYYGKFKKYFNLLKKVCKKEFKLNIAMNDKLLKEVEGYWLLDTGYYIDHKSSADEGANLEMFESYASLKNFLKYSGSIISGGNDNESPYEW